MTDYKNNPQTEKRSKRKEQFLEQSRVHSVNEKDKLVSNELESDSLVATYQKYAQTFKPAVKAKDPYSFASYASAEQYYIDAAYNIINYYPFDGTREEVIQWYASSSVVDTGLLKQYWPGSVGHFSASYNEYVNFYAGPNKVPEVEFIGKWKHSETGLTIDPAKGNTIEFWLKKDSFDSENHPKETVFDIGTYPAKAAAADFAQIKLALSASTGSPFRLTYKTGLSGSTDIEIGSNSITTSSVGDSSWHHYSFVMWASGSDLKIKLYVDGEVDSTTTTNVGTLKKINTFLGGALATTHGSATGDLGACIDDFRFWKGSKNGKQITKYFDKKAYASNTNLQEYETRLGLYYKFNKSLVDNTSVDSLVIDHSGNDIAGRIKNYTPTCRNLESAISVSTVSINQEFPDPVLDETDSSVQALREELKKIGQTHDDQNQNLLYRLIPEWAREEMLESANPTDFQILLQLMGMEFDRIKMFLDSIRSNLNFQYQETNQSIENNATGSSILKYDNNNFIGCTDIDFDNSISAGARGDQGDREQRNAGIEPYSYFQGADMSEYIEGFVGNVIPSKTVLENAMQQSERYAREIVPMTKRKGTEMAKASCYSISGYDTDNITDMVCVPDAELFLTDVEELFTTKEKLVNFSDNREACFFMDADPEDPQPSSYVPNSSGSNSAQYTFEGSFLFPLFETSNGAKILNSSIFGLHEVPAENNNLTVQDPDRSDIRISVEKYSLPSSRARFVLNSAASALSCSLESPYFRNVYKNSRWNISAKVEKSTGEPFVDNAADTYRVVFSGYNYAADRLMNHFYVTSAISPTRYDSFNEADKSFFIGAQRTNITGSVIKESDIKVLNFSAWHDALTDGELRERAKTPFARGRNIPHFSHNGSLTKENVHEPFFRIQFNATTAVTNSNAFVVLDETAGAVSRPEFYGNSIGNRYNFKSQGFAEKLEKVIQIDHVEHVRKVPIGSFKGVNEIKVKNKEIEKYKLDSRPSVRIFSFEKSLYQSISRDMVDFISGIKAFNNLLGEPVNKYRKEYKLLNHVREKYFSHIKNENQFERYVQYYKWIDSAFGAMVKQFIPASSFSNTGIENVVESHALERNKYDHKYNRLQRKDINIGTNLLAINELLYDWEHGHISSDEDEHCLWQRERKETSNERKKIQKALTTEVSGSTYVLRKLTKPYRYSVDRQNLLNIGSNRKANKKKDLYKIINSGKEISIKSEDIYEFKKCEDVLNPQKEKIYTVKTNTSDTTGYYDADADFILPFNLYSSSVGLDLEDFKHNLQITNNHDNETTLQSVWSRSALNDLPHRGVSLGLPAAERPEAYELTPSAGAIVIKSYSGPKSIFYRNASPGTFYRIGNIKTVLEPLKIGNYSKDYQIVLTNGRRLNNNHLVETEGVHLTAAYAISHNISDMVDYYVTPRTKREHVIVNRFSAPGSSESSGPYGLDRASLEYSIYDTVNYRNSLIRGVYDVLSKEKSEQFGFRSGSSTQGSIHKTNRNLRRFSGSLGHMSSSDNYFVQHAIPHHDFGYSWITSSVDEGVYSFINKNGNIGHQHNFDISGSLKSAETILFMSASKIGSAYGVLDLPYYPTNDSSVPSFIPVDFTGLNTHIYEPTDSENNLLGHPSGISIGRPGYSAFTRVKPLVNEYYFNNNFLKGISTSQGRTSGDVTGLNSLILNRQGPYGWPSWKQIRGSQHKVATTHVKNNTFSVVFRGTTPFASVAGSSQFDYSNTKEESNTQIHPRQVVNYKEIFATSRFNPITVHMHTYLTEAGIEFLQDVPLPNRLSQQARHSMWNNDEFMHEFISKNTDLYNMNSVIFPSISMRAPIANMITGFANQKMMEDIKYIEPRFRESKNLELINNWLRTNKTSPNSDAIKLEINYIETLYPKEINTYTKRARTRENFKFFGWDSTRSNRELILTGNLNYQDFIVSDSLRKYFSNTSEVTKEKEFKNSYFNSYDIIDFSSTGSTNLSSALNSAVYVNSSTWVLDSRRDFSEKPTNISSSFFVNGDEFERRQGYRGEGVLQNDYSIFPLGINSLRGAPPFAPVYNRRIPQASGSAVFLAGEAKWTVADSLDVGPFYDKYENFSEEIRLLGQSYSLVPEFTISRYIEDIYETGNAFEKIKVGSDFLMLTGAVYHTSSDVVSVGTQFFKTYSTSDFMKYFQPMRENLEQNNFDIETGKLTLRCRAVKRLLPYRGFYPAERAVQLAEIFNRAYLKEGSYTTDFISRGILTEDQALRTLRLKIENTKSHVSKPLFSPGVLFNSIKTGLAVDYPIFSSSVGTAADYFISSKLKTPIRNFSSLSLTATTCFTGSEINNTVDTGIPRVKGEVSRRVNFDDLLSPERLFYETIHDNEAHASASNIYGDRDFLRVVEHAPEFGVINHEKAVSNNSINFRQNRESFVESMLPYKSAMNNFAAETVNFFLENEKLQTIVSAPSKPRLTSGTTYKMRVYIENRDTMMYDRHSAFGPAVDEGTLNITSHTSEVTPAVAASVSFNFNDGDAHSLQGVTDQALLPRLTITDEASTAKIFKFYDQTTIGTPSAEANTQFVKANDDLTGAQIAALFNTAVGASGLAVSTGVNSARVTLTLNTAGAPSNAAIANNDSSSSVNILAGSGGSILSDTSTAWTGGVNAVTEGYVDSTTSATAASHGHLPYVAPYLDPDTTPYAEISFTPTETKEFTIPEIIEGMTVSYYNIEAPSNSTTNTNYKESMAISASVDFSRHVLLYADNYQSMTSQGRNMTIATPAPDLYRWVIQPKWETPIMDFKKASVPTINLDSNTPTTVTGSPWKTRDQTSYYAPSDASSVHYLTSSTGMWHQEGILTSGSSQGYFLTVVGGTAGASAFQFGSGQTVGDLAQEVGFLPPQSTYEYTTPEKANPSKSYKLGRIANRKDICEAVVAIPYYLTDDCDMKFFPMNQTALREADDLNKAMRQNFVSQLRDAKTKREIKQLINSYEEFYEDVGNDSAESAAYQLRMMQKYILPPQFDFLKDESLDSFVAYIFQFKATLEKKDLANIWQNVYPQDTKNPQRISIAQHSRPLDLRNAKKSDVEYITHILNPEDAPFLKGKISQYETPDQFLQEDVRWLVFKVKYRGASKYSDIVEKSISEIPENIIAVQDFRHFQDLTEKYFQEEDNYVDTLFEKASYNWPYDFFSIVEMIKMESKVDFFSKTTTILSTDAVKAAPGKAGKPKVFKVEESPFTNSSQEFQLADASSLDDIVSKQEIKADTDAVPSPANILEVAVASGYTIKTNSEKIYLNGMLQSVGAGNDYTISGNTVTFAGDLQSADKVQVSYIKKLS